MSDIPPQAAIIKETEKLWGTDLIPVGCPHCQRVFLMPAWAGETSCPLCRQGKLQPQDVRMRPAEPEKLLPFRITKADLENIYDAFISPVWLKPEDFKPDRLLRRTQPIFWPLWLVDTLVTGHWQMEAGFDYQVQSTKETYANGQWISRKQIEGRVRWEPRLGKVNTQVENVSVPALEEHENRQALTGGYHHKSAQVFSPKLLGEAILEAPDLPPEDAWPTALPLIKNRLAAVCARAAGAGHQRNFAVKASYQDQHWTQYLLPMFTTYYLDDDAQPHILVVNGETGSIQGPRLASRKKGNQIGLIIAASAAGLFLLALIGLILSMVFPPAGLIAAVLGFLGLIVGGAALIPLIWPAQWNRKQRGLHLVTGRHTQ